jgi:transposase
MTRETITLNQKEQHRVHVLTRLQAGIVRTAEAASLLDLSVRHLRRLLACFRRDGAAAVSHGNRGRPSHRRLAAAVLAQVLTLVRTTYTGVNDHHLTELLRLNHGICLSRPTVQRLLRAAGLPSPRRRRPPRHRRRRERMPQTGLLIQMDGSHHPWLEDRGPRLVLLAAIDDATGRVLAAVFRLQEDAHGYFLLLRQLIRRYGLPTAVYTDRHGIFQRDPRTPPTLSEQLAGRLQSTQVGRALHDLGIRWIGARSPQAKGRIERLFGTFQDRLVVELRLAQARTLAEAQRVLDRFLPRYNARFAQAPAHPAPAWRPAPARPVLDRICCFKYPRTVGHDNTIQLAGRLVQLHPGLDGRSYAGTRVDVHAQLDGTLAIYHRGHRLRATRISTDKQPPGRPQERFREGRPTPGTPRAAPSAPPARARFRPAQGHPWRWTAAGAARRRQLRTQQDDIFTEPIG